MKKYFFTLILGIILCFNMATVFAEDINESSTQFQDQNKTQGEFNELGRGSYRSPGGSFSGGNRGGYRTGPRSPSSDVSRNPRTQPAQPAPASRWGGFGGLLGGFAAGAIIGHFLNPFGGFGGYGGFSIISLLIWALIIYVGFKLFQKLFRRKY